MARSLSSIVQSARHFLQQTGQPDSKIDERCRRIEQEVALSGTYRHTRDEIEVGARIAWRQSARCIGRLLWESLTVRDMRDVCQPKAIFEACVEHLRLSTNGGRIVPMISVFSPAGPRILNSQLIRYADDAEQAPFLARLSQLGWRPDGRPFQVLPLAIAEPSGKTHLFEIPADSVLEVRIEHPECEGINSLGLRWHALPAMSDRVLDIGGVLYPCAPFSGWYMGTEIGARNFGDDKRYDKLPDVAQALGLDCSSDRTLWRDRALVELNRAVLRSFDRAGVTVVDHHTASRQFLRHLENEAAAGRRVSSEWSWITPPISGSATGVFHTPMSTFACSPGFLTRAEAGLDPTESEISFEADAANQI